jgi:vacuolar-type H+-ATPase subunit I/STV1
MLARVSVAQRQAKEAAAELATTKAESERQITKLEKALEAEKELHRRAKVAFESQITASGVHEAQEMVQLKMEVSALTEEVEFLRQREADVQERENNLQMIAEMNRKLGTTVSKFELDAMRGQIDSLEEEARRAILAQFCAIILTPHPSLLRRAAATTSPSGSARSSRRSRCRRRRRRRSRRRSRSSKRRMTASRVRCSNRSARSRH